MALSAVDSAALAPVGIFISQDTIYITYNEQGQDFFLSAVLPSNKPNKLATSELKIHKGAAGPFKNVLPLTDVSDMWEQVLHDFGMEIAPKENLTGVTLLAFAFNAVLYRDEAGALKIEELKQVPENIEIVRIMKQEELIQNIFSKIAFAAQQKYPDQKQFIFQIKETPRVPFVYFDMEAKWALVLNLPDFYQVQKQLLPLGFTTEFIYSFFIKSHLIPIVKAPFTTSYRLVSNTYASTIAPIFSPKVKNIKGDIPPVANAEKMDINEFNNYLDQKITTEVYKANIEMLIGGEEFFSHFMINANKAVEDIFIRLYVFCADQFSLSIADMLKRKSKEGIDVRIILDELNTVLNWNRVPTVLTQETYKMPSIKKYLKKGSKIKIRTHPNTWLTFAHSKVIVIDDDLAYTGGMNFGEDYRYFWHDMMFALRGPVVGRLKDNFKEEWAFTGIAGDFGSMAYSMTRKDPVYTGSTEGMIDVRLLYTTPTAAQIFHAQMAAIKRAKNRIYIENAYFSDERIVRELIKARERGVDVRVILPGKNNVNLMYKNNLIKTNTLIKNGIRVYMYPGMTHIKAALFDDWACVGSSNFDKYSLHINQEMNLGISDPSFIKELEERLFEKDFADAEEITEPFAITWGEYVATALSPM